MQVTNCVTTLQAVLARRCAVIGEVQQHLLRAGWHCGVAQWAVLHGWTARNVVVLPKATATDHHKEPLGGKVMVGQQDGDGIFVDDPSMVEEWTLDALALVRKQVERAGMMELDLSVLEEEEEGDENKVSFVDQISSLLDLMEKASHIQRLRRLEKLRGYSWLRRNWYIIAVSVPVVWIVGRRLRLRGSIGLVWSKMAAVLRERVAEPLASIFWEIWRGRESFSDQKARYIAIESLKKMIRSWLDETYPDMAIVDRKSMAEAMDISLLESKKEESMKTFYEINNVVRMSFIEMQYMKVRTLLLYIYRGN